MSWFHDMTGFEEESPDQVRRNLTVDGDFLTSRINGNTFRCGRLETPSLAELRTRVPGVRGSLGRSTVREVVANVQDLHTDVANAGALFQVASQFNLLEMGAPDITPERGVAIYERDRTQGPACAIAAGAGTIYRNYFVPVNGVPGQSAGNQIDCLADVGEALGNSEGRLWRMWNGYALPSAAGLSEITQRLVRSTEPQLDALRQRLRIGIQWNTQVTLRNGRHAVTQAYCSALPVAYSGISSDLWEPFGRLILEAAYDATFCAAIENAAATGNRRVYLTLLGGGAFGNETHWIADAILRALQIHQDANLDVAIVSYGSSRDFVRRLVTQFQG